MTAFHLATLLRHHHRPSREDMEGELAALHRAQAVIEFDLQGHVLMANDNFLALMGYGLDRSRASTITCSSTPLPASPRNTKPSGKSWGRANTTAAATSASRVKAAKSGCRPATTRCWTAMGIR